MKSKKRSLLTPSEYCEKIQKERRILETKYYTQMQNYRKQKDVMTTMMERIAFLNKKFTKYVLLILYRSVAYQMHLPVHNDLYDENEMFMKVFLAKKRELMEEYAALDDLTKEKSRLPFNRLMRKWQGGVRKIYKYWNQKYAIILLKTNRDIYRRVLSYL